MTTKNLNLWVPKQPVHHIFFDVDSTLSSIEGIDVLAEWNQVGVEVSAITKRCMSQTGINLEAYQMRLNLVKPTVSQIKHLSKLYIKQLTTGANEVISILQKLNKQVYLISAGIRQALLPLANHLSIPPNHTYGVDVFFDDSGHYHHFDQTSSLAQNDGKTRVIRRICPSIKSTLLIGDGLSDLEAKQNVYRFIGFGGHCIRKKIQDSSEFYITSHQLFALLPLVLTATEVDKLAPEDYRRFAKGLTAINNNQVHFKESGHV